MRAVIFRDKKLVLDEIPEPSPGPGQVLVKSRACGICGSDLHGVQYLADPPAGTAQKGRYFRLDPAEDLVLGHEYCAEVISYGPETEGKLPPGSLVCAVPVLPGESGRPETIGYSNVCPGAFAQHFCISEALMLPVPEGLSIEQATLTEPLTVGLHAVNRAGSAEGKGAVVVGCGPVGLTIIAVLKLRGIHPIIASDLSAQRREVALALGADMALDPREESPFRRFKDLARSDTSFAPNGQLIFECVGAPGMLNEVYASAMRKAVVIVAGVCMALDTIEPLYAVTKELDVLHAYGYTREEFSQSLDILAGGSLPFEKIITGVIGLSEVKQAFEDLANPQEHIKVVVNPWME